MMRDRTAAALVAEGLGTFLFFFVGAGSVVLGDYLEGAGPGLLGVALAHGPHINNPVFPEDRAGEAWKALVRARNPAANSTPVERDLIDALGRRLERLAREADLARVSSTSITFTRIRSPTLSTSVTLLT